MTKKTFTDNLIDQTNQKKTILCGGFDPQIKSLPDHIKHRCLKEHGNTLDAVMAAIIMFGQELIPAIAPFINCLKPQMAFFIKYGWRGIKALEHILDIARQNHLPIILDTKCGDGGDTATAYAEAYISSGIELLEDPATNQAPLQAAAVTILGGYIGEACVSHFVKQIKQNGTGVFIVDKTSFTPNSSIEQLQTSIDQPGYGENGMPCRVWEALAHFVNEWSRGTEGQAGWRNLGVVMGATYPEDAIKMRQILPNNWFLVPGFGNQGATAEQAVIGADKAGYGISVNSARDIHNAWCKKGGRFNGPPEQFAACAIQAAQAARLELNVALTNTHKGLAFL